MKLLSVDKRNQEFTDVLELAMADRLLIFVGAGASIEAGLPNWEELAVRYLNLGFENVLPSTLPRRFANPRQLAVLVDAARGFKRITTLTNALYPDHVPPRPGPTAKEIAKLYRARHLAGLETYIVTTNFDPLLEMALNEYVRDVLPKAVGEARGIGLDDIRANSNSENPLAVRELFEVAPGEMHRPTVFHLHGGIYPPEPENTKVIQPIIFTERDYARWEHEAQKVLSELLDELDCMMVGLGLQDNDVLNALYKKMEGHDEMKVPQPPQGARYLVALNEINRIEEEAAGQQHYARTVRKLEKRRLELLGVKSLNNLTTFAQIPQVLHEMGRAIELSRERGDAVPTSGTYAESDDTHDLRMQRWREDFRSRYLTSTSFDSEQRSASRKCQKALEDIDSLMGSTDVDDEVAIHVWVRSQDSKEHAMLPWCCNEFARRGGIPGSLKLPIEHRDFDIALRQAFEGVSSRGFLPAAEHSRWEQILGVPIISPTTKAKHRYGRLMVGVVTLSTNLDKHKSDITRCIEEDRRILAKVEARLVELGRTLLVDDCTKGRISDPQSPRIPLKQKRTGRKGRA